MPGHGGIDAERERERDEPDVPIFLASCLGRNSLKSASDEQKCDKRLESRIFVQFD